MILFGYKLKSVLETKQNSKNRKIVVEKNGFSTTMEEDLKEGRLSK